MNYLQYKTKQIKQWLTETHETIEAIIILIIIFAIPTTITTLPTIYIYGTQNTLAIIIAEIIGISIGFITIITIYDYQAYKENQPQEPTHT